MAFAICSLRCSRNFGIIAKAASLSVLEALRTAVVGPSANSFWPDEAVLQELKFPESVKEVSASKQGDGLLLSPVRPDWTSFFALQMEASDDYLSDRRDLPPQSREPLC